MKQKIGRKIIARMKVIGLSKNQTAIWAEISRTQLDSIIFGNTNYTIDILSRVLKTLDMKIKIENNELG